MQVVINYHIERTWTTQKETKWIATILSKLYFLQEVEFNLFSQLFSANDWFGLFFCLVSANRQESGNRKGNQIQSNRN